jgi:hypothetical protein
LIFIDTIVKTVLGRDVRILQNHKFLAGSLGLGSGVMVNKSIPSSSLSLSFSLYARSLLNPVTTAQLGTHYTMKADDEK